MIKFTKCLLALCLFTSFFQCKPSGNEAENTDATAHNDSFQFKKYVPEDGEKLIEPENNVDAFRPQLPLDQAAFKLAKGEDAKRLENEFEFMFDKNWKVKGRVFVKDDKVHRKDQEEYTFDRDGKYNGIIDGKEVSGTWMGRMEENAPIITVFPSDLKEKVTEWFVKNTGKTMVWSGTTSYKDNGIMIQFALK